MKKQIDYIMKNFHSIISQDNLFTEFITSKENNFTVTFNKSKIMVTSIMTNPDRMHDEELLTQQKANML